MPILLFKLNGVPLDEAEDVRELLQQKQVPFYETPQGFWGFSLGGLWLADEQSHQQKAAEELIDNYQQQRLEQARASYQPRSFLAAIAEKPLRLVLILIACVILYFSVSPFVRPLFA